MPKTQTRTSTVASLAADTVTALANGGHIRIYDGLQPYSANKINLSHTILAELDLGSPAFNAAADGVAMATPITTETYAPNSGTATWFRVFDSSYTALWDGSVGTSGDNLNLSSVSITEGDSIQITAFSYEEPRVP